nr:MAG TPA: hypothetical protein [Caudoviricetes sp.]
MIFISLLCSVYHSRKGRTTGGVLLSEHRNLSRD